MRNGSVLSRIKQCALAVLAGASLLGAPAGSAQAEDFYKGKTITIMVSSDAGSTFDIYARGLAEHMGKYIPGNPSFLVKNLPGAGGLNVTNFVLNQAPKDGTVIAATQNGIPIADMLTPDQAKFDATKLSWIGSVEETLYLIFFRKDAPIETIMDASTTEVIAGGPTPGSFSTDIFVLMNDILGTRFKIITGYNSPGKILLAVESGELQGSGQSYATLMATKSDWFKEDGLAKVLAVARSERHPEFPNVPAITEFARNDEDRAAFDFVTDRLQHGRPYFAAPEVPADRLEILRAAFESTMKDEGFIKAAAQANLYPEGTLNGEQLEALVIKEHQTPKAVQDRVSQILEDFKNRAN